MSRFLRLIRTGLPALALAATACHATPSSDVAAPAAKATPARSAPAARADRSPVAIAPVILVHKSPTCGCCAKWVDHLRAEGFTVEVDETSDMRAVKERVGIPPAKGSCHTAEVGGYFVEGHVPADDIRRLLAEKPAARGITAPGMPMGSPGMEMPDGNAPKYAVELVREDGSTEVFAEHGSDAAAADAHDHDHAH